MKYHALLVIFEKAAKFEICLLLQIIGGALNYEKSQNQERKTGSLILSPAVKGLVILPKSIYKYTRVSSDTGTTCNSHLALL